MGNLELNYNSIFLKIKSPRKQIKWEKNMFVNGMFPICTHAMKKKLLFSFEVVATTEQPTCHSLKT